MKTKEQMTVHRGVKHAIPIPMARSSRRLLSGLGLGERRPIDDLLPPHTLLGPGANVAPRHRQSVGILSLGVDTSLAMIVVYLDLLRHVLVVVRDMGRDGRVCQYLELERPCQCLAGCFKRNRPEDRGVLHVTRVGLPELFQVAVLVAVVDLRLAVALVRMPCTEISR